MSSPNPTPPLLSQAMSGSDRQPVEASAGQGAHQHVQPGLPGQGPPRGVQEARPQPQATGTYPDIDLHEDGIRDLHPVTEVLVPSHARYQPPRDLPGPDPAAQGVRPASGPSLDELGFTPRKPLRLKN